MQTRAFRPESVSESNKLFLLADNLFKPVSSTTPSHWVKNCLLEVGTDRQVFKAHSMCRATTSTTLIAGISIPETVCLAEWTNETTFKKFYYCPVENTCVGCSVSSNAAAEQGSSALKIQVFCYIKMSI